MPPALGTRPRIAVVLPRRRIWAWHQKAILTLQHAFEVDVFATACVSRYPLFLKLWINLEAKLFGKSELVKFTPMPITEWKHADGHYTLILNLSEAPVIYHNAPIADLKFDGGHDSLRLFAKLFARESPYLSFEVVTQKPIVASYLATQDKGFLTRGLQLSFARLVVLTERAARHMLANTRPPIPANGPEIAFYFLAARFVLFVIRFVFDHGVDLVVSRLVVRRYQRSEHWSVGILAVDSFNAIDQFPPPRFAVVPDNGRCMYADPFVISEEGKTWLFVEEFDYSSAKGVISCAQIAEANVIVAPRPVLARPYHLSYPFVFRHGDEIFMIPETGSNRTLELYSATSFPDDWVLRQTLLENIELYDATLLQYQGKWWIFAAIRLPGGSSQDELAIFFSESLYGPWRPHPLNPVKSDCRSARPAGKMVVRDNRLLRPAQNCEKWYGFGLVWLEIEELTTESFREKEVAHWNGGAIKANGLHTFNYDSGIAAIDIARTTWIRRSG